jgi:hypothetical protein
MPDAPSSANAGKVRIAAVNALKNRAWRFI